MVVAIYGREFEDSYKPAVIHLLEQLKSVGFSLKIHRQFKDYLNHRTNAVTEADVFSDHRDIGDVEYLVSIGGDGTLLKTVNIVRDSGIPVLGVNTGRLGFLSYARTDKIDATVNCLKEKVFTIDDRSLIRASSDTVDLGDFPYALNEIAMQKMQTSTMIIVHVWLGGALINSYWSDGLIVATPTGSTAYSLSCGGPIVMPASENILLTPIAPHNLNVRPFVIPDSLPITLQAEGREEEFLLTLDSASFTITSKDSIVIEKAPFKFRLINLEEHNFFNTIRNKLSWGRDVRN